MDDFRKMIQTINFVSWNTNGLNHPIKRKKVFKVFQRLNAHIIFVQETHVRKEDSYRFFRSWRGQQYHSNSNAKVKGVSIFIDSSIAFIQHDILSDPNGRFLLITGLLGNKKVALVNVYAPNVDCPDFLSPYLLLYLI